jgi:hypothetical protein
MRGQDEQQLDVFRYISPEQRVPQDHPLGALRMMTDEALRELQPRFRKLYAKTGRPSIAPEKLLRALLLQALYSVRSERLLMVNSSRCHGANVTMRTLTKPAPTKTGRSAIGGLLTSANDDPRAKPPEQLQDSGKGDCSGCGCGFRLRTNAENSVMTSPIGKG